MKKIGTLLAVGCLAAAVSLPAMAQPKGPDAGPGPAFEPAFAGKSAAEWVKQRDKIRAQLFAARADWLKHYQAMTPLRNRKRVLRLELRILLLKTPVNMNQVAAKVKQINDVRGKITVERIKFRLAMKKKYPELNRWRGRGFGVNRGFRRGHRGYGFRRGGCPGGPGGRGGWGRGSGFRGGPGPRGGGMYNRGMM